MGLTTTVVNGAGSMNANISVGDKPEKVKQIPVRVANANKDSKKKDSPQLNLKELEMALENAVKNTRFSYRVNDNIDMVVVKIIDKNTDEIIKEIPGEEIQKLHENLQEAIGLLFDTEI
jgi:flagellar protein FlaG